MLRIARNFVLSVSSINKIPFPTRSITSSSVTMKGFEDFYDQVKPDEVMTSGRGWTAADLRKKNFNDLHALWWILYKERNLLLTSRQKYRQKLIPMPQLEENRYIRVKRSMAAIKLVLDERKKIDAIIKATKEAEQASGQNQS